MIISRAPFRISLGGGGTDLPSYYEKYEGFLISGAIDKHIYVGANKQFYKSYSLKYSDIEIVDTQKEIKHKLIREAVKFLDIKPGIEITSLADIPSKTGLGSSGAFLVALLNTLHHYKGDTDVTKRMLAEEACTIELDILKEHEGKQDKYVSSFGKINAYRFHRNGDVSVQPLRNTDIITLELSKKLFLFFTGVMRTNMASDALKEQDVKVRRNDEDMTNKMHAIKDIGIQTKDALENCEFDEFGKLLNEHWEIKKQYSSKATNPFIDKVYKDALKYGALGGKAIGAPGGGFLMFYHPGDVKMQWEFVDNMEKSALIPVPFKFDEDGIKIVTKEKI